MISEIVMKHVKYVQTINIFDIFSPGQRVQMDFAVRGNQNFLSIVCVLTGYIQVYKTSNQRTSEDLKYMRTWAANFGMSYEIKSDFGPSFRHT